MSAPTEQEHRVADATASEAIEAESARAVADPNAASDGAHADSGMRGIHTLSMAKAIIRAELSGRSIMAGCAREVLPAPFNDSRFVFVDIAMLLAFKVPVPDRISRT